MKAVHKTKLRNGRPRKRAATLPPRVRRRANGQTAEFAEWEAMKAACRDLSHQEAVSEVAFLSQQYRDMWRAMAKAKVELKAIVRALRVKKVPFVLTGAYGIAGWTGRPRATHDVDILVRAGRNHARAVNVVKALYPELE